MLTAGMRVGPYEVVAPIGAGGMGEVYRARDPRLDRDVAIKVLPPEYAADPDRLFRFEQEARAAAALNHPNIVALYDIGTHDGAPYIVTELLEGESLRDKLTGSPLPSRKVLGVAIQVASGLAAAHEKGIVHRDLKPENLFVTSDGRVKILDFGVAKLAPRRQAAEAPAAPTVIGGTDPGIVMGTVGYMSPEQVRGLPVDHRSDIFSLGCVLYEMVTGRRAFARATAADTMSAILSDEPPDPSSIEKTVPAPLSRAIAHCLEKSPGERFHSAHDLGFELRAILADTGGAQARPGMPALQRRRVAWLAAGGAAIVLIATGVNFALRGMIRKASVPLDSKRIVVAVFENQTGDSSLDPLGRMASDWITQGLSQIEGLEVVPSTSVLVAQPPGSPAPARRDPLQTLAEETGAGMVVSGSYYLQGERLYFQARISDAVHRKLLHALDPASSAVTTPLAAIDALRRGLMGALATSFGPSVGRALQQRPPSYDAYREFINGFELFLTDDSESLRHMERAAEIDPDFATPLLWAAYLRRIRGDWAEVETILKRLNEQRDRLTPAGRHWLDGTTGWIFHRYGEGLQAFRSVQKLAPRDPLVNLRVGVLAVFSNRPEEAAATFGSFPKQPWGNHPLGAAWIVRYCDSLHMLGRFKDELEEARRGREQFAEDAGVRYSEVSALAALDRLDEMSRVLQEIEAAQIRDATPADAMLFAARELRAHGHREESLRLAERAVAWYRGRPPQESTPESRQRGLADALFWAEQWNDSRVLFESLASGGSPQVDDTGMLGVTAARAGDRATALRVAGELERLDRKWLFGVHTYYRAGIAANLGEKEKAVELLREAFAQGQAYGTDLHSSLTLEPLWDYPPFQELLRPKG